MPVSPGDSLVYVLTYSLVTRICHIDKAERVTVPHSLLVSWRFWGLCNDHVLKHCRRPLKRDLLLQGYCLSSFHESIPLVEFLASRAYAIDRLVMLL